MQPRQYGLYVSFKVLAPLQGPPASVPPYFVPQYSVSSASGCSASAPQFVTLLAAPQPSFRQLLCPSPIFVHSLLRSAPFHPFAPKHLLQGMAALPILLIQAIRAAHTFPQAISTMGSLGSITLLSVGHSLRRVQSTRCLYLC